MRCYYHEDREAVGACKSCGKGLCQECAVDLTKGLACRGRCEPDVQAIIQLMERSFQFSGTSARVLQTSRGVRSSNGIFCIVVGIVLVVFGLRDMRFLFEAIIGLSFIAYGIYWLF